MRVLGFSFDTEADAQQARTEIVKRFELNAEDADLGPLADDGVVLAVRAREDNFPEISQIVGDHGGREVVDVPEEWTRAPHA